MRKRLVSTVSVLANGQIPIPVDMREMLGIKKGDRFLLAAICKKILVEKARKRAKNDDFVHLTMASEKVAGGLWYNEKDGVWDDL